MTKQHVADPPPDWQPSAQVIELMAHVERVDAQISATVRGLRESLNLSPYVLAESLGLSYETMNRRLRGQRAWTVPELIKLAGIFKVSIEDLCTGLGGRLPVPDPSAPAETRATAPPGDNQPTVTYPRSRGRAPDRRNSGRRRIQDVFGQAA